MKYAKILKFCETNLAAIFLALFFITEAYSKYSFYYEGGKSDIPKAIKFIVIIILVIGILKPLKNLVYPILLGVVFCLGQAFIPNGFNAEIIVGFSKLLFPILLFLYFNKNPLEIKDKQLLFKVFEFIIVVNCFLIVLGFFVDIRLFQTYTNTRFGYSGLIITSSTVSYVYALALFYFLIKLKQRFFRQWMSLLIIGCCLLIGTKLLYISLLGSFVVYIIWFSKFSRLTVITILGSFGVVCVLLFYFFFFEYGIFNSIRVQDGLLSSILSFRDELLLTETVPYIENNWTWVNYLFGGISDLAIRSQFGFVDVLLFWGLFGGIIYLFYFYKAYVTFRLQKSITYLLLLLLINVFVAGNFFENASVAIYLLIFRERILNENLIPKPQNIVIA